MDLYACLIHVLVPINIGCQNWAHWKDCLWIYSCMGLFC